MWGYRHLAAIMVLVVAFLDGGGVPGGGVSPFAVRRQNNGRDCAPLIGPGLRAGF
jgi:hypothetical protein